MRSTTFTALARWADNQGCDIAAMHELAGAMQHTDGVALVLFDDARGSYCVASVHVKPDPPTCPGFYFDPERDRVNAIQESIVDLLCGDRHWTTHVRAMRAFNDMVMADLNDGC